MKNVLVIEDSTSDFLQLEKSLAAYAVRLYWARTITQGKDLLKALPTEYFTLVVTDFLGTSLDPEVDFKTINHPRVVLTSGIVLPKDMGICFIQKENLADYIKTIISE